MSDPASKDHRIKLHVALDSSILPNVNECENRATTVIPFRFLNDEPLSSGVVGTNRYK